MVALAYGNMSVDQAESELTPQASIIKYITLEIRKLLHSQTKVSQTNLLDLETKVQLEIYLREKKSAILLDRKDITVIANDDTESHLSRV